LGHRDNVCKQEKGADPHNGASNFENDLLQTWLMCEPSLYFLLVKSIFWDHFFIGTIEIVKTEKREALPLLTKK
jgi:hypothetical protein